MTTFPYQYAPMPSTQTALPGIDDPLATTTTTTTTNTVTSPSANTSTDISTNISNLMDSVKNFDTTTLMMIGGSIVILFLIFKQNNGQHCISFVDNILIVWVVKKIIGSDSRSNSISVGQPLPDSPIILIPKQGPMREIPQVMGNPPVSMAETNIFSPRDHRSDQIHRSEYFNLPCRWKYPFDYHS